MEEVLSTPELLAIIFKHGGRRTTLRQVCTAWREEVDAAPGRPEPNAQVRALDEGTFTEDLTKGKLAQLLAIGPDQAARYPHDVRRRFGGGEYHVFAAATVLAAFRDHGGLEQLAQRVWLGKKRARDVDEQALRQAALERADRLDRGLSAIGLAARSDSCWQRRALGSASFWKLNLAATLRSAAWMHWLHEHTQGRYQDAVDDAVAELADDANHHFPGIYGEAIRMVQQRSEFQLPEDGLPWLGTAETTAEALARAEHAVDPELARRRRRREDVQERREQAKAGRRQAFDQRVAERFAGLPPPPPRVWHTAARVRAFLERDTIQPSARERDQAMRAVEDAARLAPELVQIQGARWDGICLDQPEHEIIHTLRAHAQERLLRERHARLRKAAGVTELPPAPWWTRCAEAKRFLDTGEGWEEAERRVPDVRRAAEAWRAVPRSRWNDMPDLDAPSDAMRKALAAGVRSRHAHRQRFAGNSARNRLS